MLKFLKIICIQKIYLQNCCNSRKNLIHEIFQSEIFYFEFSHSGIFTLKIHTMNFYFGISFAVQRIHLCINNYNKNKMKYF